MANQKISVIDEAGLDALLMAVFAKLNTAYVNSATFESRVQEILDEMPTNSGAGFVSFEIRESDGHLIMYYSGDTAPDASINENGHLILTL